MLENWKYDAAKNYYLFMYELFGEPNFFMNDHGYDSAVWTPHGKTLFGQYAHFAAISLDDVPNSRVQLTMTIIVSIAEWFDIGHHIIYVDDPDTPSLIVRGLNLDIIIAKVRIIFEYITGRISKQDLQQALDDAISLVINASDPAKITKNNYDAYAKCWSLID